MEPGARAMQLSRDLMQELSQRKSNEIELQKVSSLFLSSSPSLSSLSPLSLQLNPPCPQSLEERQQLPISSKAAEIVTLVHQHRVIIIRGNTGCGKTTQVPQFILDDMIAASNGAHCNIVVTQVRNSPAPLSNSL